MSSVGAPIYWVGFLVFVLGMLALDLLVFNRKAHVVSMREALLWSLIWITLSMCFAGLVWWKFGERRALEFVTGWVVEKALSVNNIFVFIVLFGYFAVPEALRHRVLFWESWEPSSCAPSSSSSARRCCDASTGSCTGSARSWSSPAPS